MKRILCCLLLLAGALGPKAQVMVEFRLETPARTNDTGAVYIAGSFNGWNPQSEKGRLQRDAPGRYSLRLSLPAGAHEYKFTRGGWNRGEAGPGGKPAPNRQLLLARDTVVGIQIEHWADGFQPQTKMSTRSPNVQVLDTAFYMPQLGRSRRVWIYLPPGYASSRERYPVLYMHDGQNVFDEATSFSGEWGVDEALDTLCPGVPPSIIVAIDNGGETRMNEYSPFDMEAYGKGEGAAYADFLALTLKPFIDARFRTLKSRRHTFTAGSSMGGLISFYILLRHPRVFGGAGVFSPAFWVAPAIKEYAATRAKQVKGKIYFFAGQRESESMVPDLLALFQIMNRLSPASMTTVIRAEGKHEEATWRKEFPLFYQWMLCGTAD